MFSRGLLATLLLATASVQAYDMQITIPDTTVNATVGTAAALGAIYAAPLVTKAAFLATNNIFKGLSTAQLKIAESLDSKDYASFIKKYQENFSNFFENDEAAYVFGYMFLLLGGTAWLIS